MCLLKDGGAVKCVKTALCVVLNISLSLAEKSVTMVIVTILSLVTQWTYSDSFVTDYTEGIWTSHHIEWEMLKSSKYKNNGNLHSPHWLILWELGALGGVPLVYCRTGFWTPFLTLFLCLRVLMFGALQSGWGGGKDRVWCGRGDGCIVTIQRYVPLRPSTFTLRVKHHAQLISEDAEFIYVKLREQCIAFCSSLETTKALCLSACLFVSGNTTGSG